MMTDIFENHPCFEKGFNSSLTVSFSSGYDVTVYPWSSFNQARWLYKDGLLVLNFGSSRVTLVGFGLQKLIKPLLEKRSISKITAFQSDDRENDFDVWVHVVAIEGGLDDGFSSRVSTGVSAT